MHEVVEIRSTPLTVEILRKGTRLASHVRMVQWAQKIGPYTAQLFERMMADKPHPEMGYRGCLGVIRLAEKYSHARMEAAAERALLTGACR